MIYEWYTGSDRSGSVPKRLTDLEQRGQELDWTGRVEILRELLDIERETNTRGYLLWRIGGEYVRADRRKEALQYYLQASKEFDPLLGTISGVMPAYCHTLLFLIGDLYYDHGDMERVAALSLSVIANLEEAKFTDFNRGMIFFYQGKALSSLARKLDLPWLEPLALASYLRWHHEAPEEEAYLEHLAYAYFRLGDMAHCRSVVEMCLEVAPAGEVRERMEEFTREHRRELAGPKGN